jgi:hypothetical protein
MADMNRLQSEFQRLFLPASGDPHGWRALVIELTGPADWGTLGPVWRGVQVDLQLPAPAIAVSGTDGLQLWFSLQAPVTAARAADFLARLRAHYLPGIAPARIRLRPSATDGSSGVPPVPAPSASTGNWSAFVAPDLAPIFADTPWLDVEPGVDGQADLLARLASIKPAAFEAALQRLSPAPAGPSPSDAQPTTASAGPDVDARRFLQQVLNDETVALSLRIDAAKALLQAAGPSADR